MQDSWGSEYILITSDGQGYNILLGLEVSYKFDEIKFCANHNKIILSDKAKKIMVIFTKIAILL